jgi:hypothetical protein
MPTFLTIWRRSLCAVTGAIAGGIVGMIVGLFQAAMPVVLAMPEILRLTLILGGFAWLVILLIVGVWLHYGAVAIALPSLITTLITAFLTVYLANKLQVALLAVWLGLVVGTLVGLLLCRLCRMPTYTTGRAQL